MMKMNAVSRPPSPHPSGNPPLVKGDTLPLHDPFEDTPPAPWEEKENIPPPPPPNQFVPSYRLRYPLDKQGNVTTWENKLESHLNVTSFGAEVIIWINNHMPMNRMAAGRIFFKKDKGEFCFFFFLFYIFKKFKDTVPLKSDGFIALMSWVDKIMEGGEDVNTLFTKKVGERFPTKERPGLTYHLEMGKSDPPTIHLVACDESRGTKR